MTHVLFLQCLKDDDKVPVENRMLARATEDLRVELTIARMLKPDSVRPNVAPYDRVVIGGAGWSVWEKPAREQDLRDAIDEAVRLGKPTLGICYGAQLLAAMQGGNVVRDNENAEYGSCFVGMTDVASRDKLVHPYRGQIVVQQSHRDRILEVPSSETLATSPNGVLQAFRIKRCRALYGVQFHPERDLEGWREILHHPNSDYTTGRAAAIERGLLQSPEANDLLRRFMTADL